jgi:HTH-type transcriptional regulator, cell division transcriptional repressor
MSLNNALYYELGNEAAQDTLGGRIVNAREALGFTTAELALRLGVTEETLANWENDRAEPRSNRLSMLAGLLGVSLSWLLTGAGSAPSSATTEVAGQDLSKEVGRIRAEAVRLVERLDHLGKEIRRVEADSGDA